MPTTDAGVGSLDDPDEVSGCAGQDNFKFTRTVDNGLGVDIGAGMKEFFALYSTPQLLISSYYAICSLYPIH